ncbi:MAG: hypothetical protein QXW97_03000 [Candidatus Pacearchaeota archaeon]
MEFKIYHIKRNFCNFCKIIGYFSKLFFFRFLIIFMIYMIGAEKNNKTKRTYEKILFFVFFGIILLLFLLPDISSIGITPGRTTINYEKGYNKNSTFSILNSEHKNMKVLLTVQGELNKSITLYDALVEFLPSDESKQFTFNLKIDKDLEPGLHTAEIVALEVPDLAGGKSYVGATVAVISQIHVYVPYPGKYVDADLNLLDGEQNGTSTFIIPVVNRGKIGIGEVRAIIDIYSPLNEKVASIETDYRSLDAGQRTELSAKWFVNVSAGNYLAKFTVFYDGESRSFEKQISIGKQILSIESILVNNFHLGEIAKLQILVENRWSQELKDVYANLLVYNKENQVMADVKSSQEIIPALSKKELIAYWDTVGVDVGEYNGKLMVKYGEKSTDKNLILKIKEDSLDIIGVGFAIRPNISNKGMSLTFILIVLIVILILVNLAWFVFFKRMTSKKKK